MTDLPATGLMPFHAMEILKRAKAIEAMAVLAWASDSAFSVVSKATDIRCRILGSLSK